MKSAPLLPPLRPHEWVFGVFLVITTVRLIAAGAWAIGLEFGAMTASVVAVAAIGRRWPGWYGEVLRLSWLSVLVGIAYVRLGAAVAGIGTAAVDDALLRLDRGLLGETPALVWVRWNHPLLTEFLSACYFLFYPATLAAFLAAVVWRAPHGGRFMTGMISIYAIGFLGYTMLPASGPHLAWAALLPEPAHGWWLTRVNAAMVAGSNHVDVFPSLHTALTLFWMGILWWWRRRLFYLFLVPAAGLCTATLYLRYHYAVDLLAGAVLAGLGLWLAGKPSGRLSPRA
jgi:membrane-associated phospholipid phosphatase